MNARVTLVICAGAALGACGDGHAENSDGGLPTIVVDDPAQAAALPARVRGHLELSGAALTGTVRAPALSAVDGTLRVTAEGLEALALPALRSVGGDCVVDGAAALQALAVPKLERCAGGLLVSDAPALAALEAPALASASWLVLERNRTLAAVALPVLDIQGLSADATATGHGLVQVHDNIALRELALPALRGLSNLMVTGNTQLTRLSLPAARGPASLLVYSELLEELDLGALVGLQERFGGSQLNADSLSALDLSALRDAPVGLSVSSSSLRTLALPALASASSLDLFAPTLTSLSAPKLASVERLAAYSHSLVQVDLTSLAEGCGQVEFRAFNAIPACAASAVLPSCPAEALTLRDDCSCGADGDLSAVSCPEPSP